MEKSYTTDCYDTFILVAGDTKVSCGTKPPSRANKPSIAELQYNLLMDKPYSYTSDDVLFLVHAQRNDLTKQEYPSARTDFFSKPKACLRASPLTKTYGFGIHANRDGKLAICGMETQQYEKFVRDTKIHKVAAMRNRKG